MTRDHKLFLNWLITFSFIFFLFFLLWDKDIIQQLLSADRSYITTIILFSFFVICMHCGFHTFIISSELNKAHIIKKNLLRDDVKLRLIDDHLILSSKGEMSDGIVSQYFKDLINLRQKGNTDNSQILDTYIKKANGSYEFGWFAADIMLKLGLIGTVIGFIIMLGSLSDITTFDVTLLQGVLTTMGSGMGVALYTTLSALVTGVLVALQYYNLESGCEELFSVLNQVSEISLDKSF